MTRALHRLSIGDLHAAYAAGKLDPVDATDRCIARIRSLDPELCAFIELDEDGIRAAAAESRARIEADAARPLEGVPLAVKANIHVRGLEANAGLEARRGIIAAKDADAVARLRAAGAIILGTLNMHEAALGADNDNPWFGRAFNPHGEGRTPGGSSGGSGAAVAAGLCVGALGTDTLGSIRIPAAYCGVYGLKPTHGAVSQHGLELVAEEFDSIGPLARSLDDLELLFRVIADPGPRSPITEIVLVEDLGGVDCEPAVLDAYDRALAAVRSEGFTPTEALALDLKSVRLAGFIRASRELGVNLAPLAAARPEGLSDRLKFLLDYGRRQSGAEVAETEALLEDAREATHAAIGDGALLTPAAPQVAFIQGNRAPSNQADFTALANIAGVPALAVPAGTDGDGLPVGVQLVGTAGNELGLIELARRLEPHLGGFVPPPTF